MQISKLVGIFIAKLGIYTTNINFQELSPEEITKREQGNDGRIAHLYYSCETDTWLGYGCSAYALRQYFDSVGYDSLRSYSRELKMPCVVVTGTTVKRLRSILKYDMGDGYMAFHLSAAISIKDFERWSKSISFERATVESEDALTSVSRLVPREGFIPDGMSSFARNTKRLFDLLCATICLVVFSPLILLVYIAVRCEDGGPAIFKQERIGRFGKPFFLYKFRSMRVDAEKMGPQLSHSGGDGDPRLTRVGRFIRAHHLDELPQFWNVFLGDMSFVGPRPERKFYIDQIMEYDKRYAYLYQIRPGVTSYATLYNGYTDTMQKMLRRLEYDLYYLGHRSWWFDITILFKTFCAIVFGKKF